MNEETHAEKVARLSQPHCRFCSTRNPNKDYVMRERGNYWSATICEDCIVACAEALQQLRKNSRRKAAQNNPSPPPESA